MDAGSGMLYPAQSVDGVVHTYGGNELREMLQAVASDGVDAAGQPVRCAVGRAVVTPSAGSLRDGFDRIAHTVPPFWIAVCFVALDDMATATHLPGQLCPAGQLGSGSGPRAHSQCWPELDDLRTRASRFRDD